MRKIKVPARLYRAGTVTCTRAAPEEGEDGRRIELTFSSEEPVERFYGWEILGHAPGEVELGRIASGAAPLLMDHRSDLDHQVGVVVSAAVENGRGRAVVRFGASSRAAELLARVREGEVSSVSVGYRIKKLTQAGERDGEPVYRATAWEPLEISLVAVPADASVGVGRADLREVETVSLSVEGDMPNPNPTPEPESRAAPTPAPAAPRAEDVLAQERGRVAAIRATAAQFDLPDDMVRKAEAEGTAPEAFQRAVLDHLATRNQAEVNAGASRLGLSEREVKRFSFLRALNYLSNPNDRRAREAAGFEREVSEAAAQALGRTAQGLMVPEDVLRQSMRASDQLVGTATAGGNLVDEVLLSGSFIDILRNTAILPRLGVRTLAGLTGDVAIPKQTGASTAYWVGEDGAPTNSGVAFGQVKMTPHTVGAITQLSRKLLIQSSVDVEAMVRGDIAAQIALAIDHAGLNGNADTDAPDGLGDAVGINTVDLGVAGSPTFAEVVEMWRKVAEGNAAMGSLAYATSPAVVEHCMTTPKFAGGDTPIMATQDRLNGYRNEWSNQVAAGQFWFGNWSDFVVGLWSGLDLTVDAVTQADSGAVRVIALQDVDFGVRHDESFSLGEAAA